MVGSSGIEPKMPGLNLKATCKHTCLISRTIILCRKKEENNWPLRHATSAPADLGLSSDDTVYDM